MATRIELWKDYTSFMDCNMSYNEKEVKRLRRPFNQIENSNWVGRGTTVCLLMRRLLIFFSFSAIDSLEIYWFKLVLFIDDIKLCLYSMMDASVASQFETAIESGSSQDSMSKRVFVDVLGLKRHGRYPANL